MHGGEVVALHEVLGQALPVRLPRLGLAVAEHHVFHVVVAHQRHQAFQPRPERRGLPVEIDEEESLPHLHRDLGQSAARLVEIVAALDERRAHEPPAQVVGPGVIRALEMLRVAGSARDRHAAVPADVGKHSQPAVPGAYHQQRLPEQIDRPVVAGSRRLLYPTDADPFRAEQRLYFGRQEFRRCVEAGRHPPCLPVRTAETGAKRLANTFHGVVRRYVFGGSHHPSHVGSQVLAPAGNSPSRATTTTAVADPRGAAYAPVRAAIALAPPRSNGPGRTSVSSQSVFMSGTDFSRSAVYG